MKGHLFKIQLELLLPVKVASHRSRSSKKYWEKPMKRTCNF